MIQLKITMTGKNKSRDEYSMIDVERENFSDLPAAKKYLKDRYGKCIRKPIYRDTIKGAAKCGYVFCFRNADLSHSPVERWLQQDWVEFLQVTPLEFK